MERWGGPVEMRLQKILSDYGVASRRGAEELILRGEITVNGRQAGLGDRADPERDLIQVKGVPLGGRPEPVFLMLNKPRGFVTTARDEQGRRTVLDLVADAGERVYPVGRLDLNSEGLLLLTNDGALCQGLTHPSHQVDKTYLAWVTGDAAAALPALRRPMVLDGQALRPARVSLRNPGLLEMTIHEGKNRQVRRMCEHVGLVVTRLKRIRVGELTLGELPVGAWRRLTPEEVSYLRGLINRRGSDTGEQ